MATGTKSAPLEAPTGHNRKSASLRNCSTVPTDPSSRPVHCCMYVSVCMCVCACVHVCVRACMSVHAYVHVHAHALYVMFFGVFFVLLLLY